MVRRDRNRSYQQHSSDPWTKELNDLIRGASGGFLFGIPLIYTMEVWWIGSFNDPPIMLLILGLTYFVLFLLNRVEGFRQQQSNHPIAIALESVEALSIGLVCSAFMLFILNRITLETSLDEILGKIVFESIPFSLGVALAKLLLSGEYVEKPSKRIQDAQQKRQNPPQSLTAQLKDTLKDTSGTIMGAIIISFSIAPTDEVDQLSAAASPPRLLIIIGISLLISYIIVFAAGFNKQEERERQQGFFQTPTSETIFSYLVSLLVAFLMLWLFQQITFSEPWFMWLSYTIVLGLPATIGGAAGRLAV